MMVFQTGQQVQHRGNPIRAVPRRIHDRRGRSNASSGTLWLSFQALYGPDLADVADWQEIATAFVDNLPQS